MSAREAEILEMLDEQIAYWRDRKEALSAPERVATEDCITDLETLRDQIAEMVVD